ncbi:MAG: iron chelate uptake ABC transporter family permease subunit [Clostridium sp.]|nr:iron chelate uptake ABC transporter family permease subunit [Clostridium sp.]MDU7082681.1 iron chelate uptake ABC transporter family permease subunit [Clostridium sp.]
MKVKSLEEKDYRDRKRLFILGAIAVAVIGLFLFQGLNARNFSYNLSRRIPKVIAIVLTGGSIAFSSMIFQTVTNNRILTPSILGLDSLYMFIQTISVFLFGASSVFMVNKNVNFLVSVVVMLAGTLILYQFLFKKSGKNNLFFLLLVGTVLGTLFKSMTSFMQVLIDPNEFEVLQSKMFASFSNVNTDILIISIVAVLIIVVLIYDQLGKLDVMLLGREQAINLGIDYDKFSKKILLIVAVLVSISTALVGQITFLGLLVVNLSYQFFESYKHKYQIMGAVLISIIALVGGQFVVERILNFSSTVSIIINFIGGIYFIYLLLQEGK